MKKTNLVKALFDLYMAKSRLSNVHLCYFSNLTKGERDLIFYKITEVSHYIQLIERKLQ